MEQGFYKAQEDSMLFAPNFVYSKNYTLLKEDKDSYTYPVDDWYWFDTKVEAYAFFNIPLEQEENNG